MRVGAKETELFDRAARDSTGPRVRKLRKWNATLMASPRIPRIMGGNLFVVTESSSYPDVYPSSRFRRGRAAWRCFAHHIRRRGDSSVLPGRHAAREYAGRGPAVAH